MQSFFCFAFSEIFSPCFGSGGDRWPHITFIYATLIYSPLDGKGHRQVLFMGWVWVHLYDLSSLFFSHCNVFCVFFCGDFPQNSVMIKTVLGESIALNYLFFRRLLYSTYFLTDCWCCKVVTLVISFCC